MAGYYVTSLAQANTAAERYLSDLAGRLHGPWRSRAAILAEIRDGLDQAITDNTTRGMTADRAAATAVKQFGTPQAVAHAFAGELATAYARHTIASFIFTGPLVGIWWLLLLHPRPWRSGPGALLAAIPVTPLIALVMATALGIFATTGSLIRWLPETPPARALAATTVTAGLCLIADATVLIIFAVHTNSPPPAALAAMAATASLIRMVCSIRTVWRSIQFRQYVSDHMTL